MAGVPPFPGLTIHLSVPPRGYIRGTRKGNREFNRDGFGETVMRKLEQRSSVNLIFLIRIPENDESHALKN